MERLQTRVGEPVETHTETLSFADENPVGRLQQIAMAHPGKAIYLTGTLTLELHPLEVGVLQLSEQWVVGSLTVSIQTD